MTTPKSDVERLHLLMDALAESVADASDAEILEDARATTEDPTITAAHVRGVLGGAILKVKKARPQKAKDGHATAVAGFRARSTALPEDPAALRALLAGVTTEEAGDATGGDDPSTSRLRPLTDEDVEGALRQLDALGLLNDDDSGGT